MKNALLFSISLFISGLVLAANEEVSLVVNYTKSDVSCFGKQDGKIELSISGGKKPYAIKWNNGASEMILENLNKGYYDVTVRDAAGKEQLESIEITAPSPISIQYNSPIETYLDANSGSLNATFSGGTPFMVEDKPFYVVRLNDSFGIENGYLLEDGIYTMDIEDAQGCSLTTKVNLDVEVIDSNRTSQKLNNMSHNELGNVKLSIYPTKALNQLVSITETIEQ